MRTLILPAALAGCVCLALGAAPAGKEAPAGKATTTRPATSETTAPASQPTSAGVLLATVGDRKVTSERIDRIVAHAARGIPEETLAKFRDEMRGKMILQELVRAYLDARKIECDEEDLKAEKTKIADLAKEQNMTAAEFMAAENVTDEMLRERARVGKLIRDVGAKEKVDAFVKANPSYFDGTTVTASHILISCSPVAATVEQKAAVEKLEKVAAEVQAGKVKFEDAAKQYSSCPSKDKGGDLGAFAFHKMVPPFSQTAFALKVGQTSGIVRTEFGFHLIKVTKRDEGKGSPVPNEENMAPEQIAKSCIMSLLQNEIVGQAMTTCPIVLVK